MRKYTSTLEVKISNGSLSSNVHRGWVNFMKDYLDQSNQHLENP